MTTDFDSNYITATYHSNSQIARILTENWVKDNMYCPRCGETRIKHFENNRPVADFFCPNCHNEYELKSKDGNLGHKVSDGAYSTMIDRITSNNNPDFFFMSYSKNEMKVKDLILVPKHFFVPDIIEKRNPLSPTARRAGWIGCNILVDKIPNQGIINIISNGNIADIKDVVKMVNKSNQLAINIINGRGWLMDILHCINIIPTKEFTLNEIYKFEKELHIKYPKNNNIKPKIRQQLQFLRDRGVIEFLGDGRYMKIM